MFRKLVREEFYHCTSPEVCLQHVVLSSWTQGCGHLSRRTLRGCCQHGSSCLRSPGRFPYTSRTPIFFGPFLGFLLEPKSLSCPCRAMTWAEVRRVTFLIGKTKGDKRRRQACSIPYSERKLEGVNTFDSLGLFWLLPRSTWIWVWVLGRYQLQVRTFVYQGTTHCNTILTLGGSNR